MVVLLTIIVYFVALLVVSRLASGRGCNDDFFRAGRRSPWPMVAVGMVGASISGVTVVSVPGMVQTSQMTYLAVCLGFVVGYVVVAMVLLPLYYRLGLTSIYAYLGVRLGRSAHATGAWFFLLSKLTGAALKFYVVCMIVQQLALEDLGVPFEATVAMMVGLIWVYSHRGGIATLVRTDVMQTVCLVVALVLIAGSVASSLGLSVGEAAKAVSGSSLSRMVDLSGWQSPHYFWKQLLSGVFIVVVMTGLDQDMMQKNLTCRSLRDAQKDMCCYGLAFVPVNLLLLGLGVLLTMHPALAHVSGDALLTEYVGLSATPVVVVFTVGIVAASFSSADSALASLTTCYCLDIRRQEANERLRRRVHAVLCLLFVVVIVVIRQVNSRSLIDAVYTLVGYTYGPLLGLFAFALATRRVPRGRWVPWVCVASPLLCCAIDVAATQWTNYRFGYELLMLNGAITFLGLWLSSQDTRWAEGQTAS